MSLIFKVDTKGSCLLCLSPSPRNSGSNKINDLDSTTAFKMLLRYLKVDWQKVVTSSSNSVGSDNILGLGNCTNLSVSLCEECSAVANDFLELFQSFENIRIQLDLCVQQLHEFMENGNHDKERGREYERYMNTGNVEDMMSANIAQKLRKETMEKAFQKLASTLPRISLACSNTPNNWCENGTLPQIKDQGQPLTEIPETSILERLLTVSSENDSVSQPQYSADVEETEPVEIVNVAKCKYCEFCVTNTDGKYLQVHQYSKHAKSLLSDKGLLPPSISEQQLEAALSSISGLGELKDPTQCQFCERWFKRKYHLRGHLLQNHLCRVIEEVEKFAGSTEERFPQVSKFDQFDESCLQQLQTRKHLYKCDQCGETFLNKLAFKRHKLDTHLRNGLKKLLPSSLSEQGVITVLKKITAKSKVSPRTGKETYKCYECFWCKQQVYKLKSHLLECHLSQIVNAVKRSQPQTSLAAKYKCKYCRKQLWTLAGLKYHCSLKHNMTITTVRNLISN